MIAHDQSKEVEYKKRELPPMKEAMDVLASDKDWFSYRQKEIIS